MTNVDNILQLGLFFSPSALQPNRKLSQKHKTKSDSVQGVIQVAVGRSHLDFVMALCFHS